MKLETVHQGRVTILRPHGDIKIGEGDVALKEAIRKELEAGQRHFVLNLEGVRFMDSAGLGELVANLKRVREAGGDLKVCGANQRISDAFHVTQLVKVLEIYPTEQEAIASFV